MNIGEKTNLIMEAQKILDWAITNLNGRIRCKVVDYRNERYLVQFFTEENELIRGVNIYEEWVEDTNPKDNFIHDELYGLLRKLEKEAKRKRG